MNFSREVEERVRANPSNKAMVEAAERFMVESVAAMYPYNFEFLGRPIIQYPQDIVALQEVIWKTKPDLIIETGIARGGSLVFSASMLALLEYCDAVSTGCVVDPRNPSRIVVGVDIDIRAHNRDAIDAHPMRSRINMIQGSSIATEIVDQVRAYTQGRNSVLVILDSNHTYAHVLEELKFYAPMVTAGSYCIVFDTVVEDLPADMFPDRPWGPGDNPKIAVHEFLKTHAEFEIDKSIDNKVLVTVAPDGYLRRLP